MHMPLFQTYVIWVSQVGSQWMDVEWVYHNRFVTEEYHLKFRTRKRLKTAISDSYDQRSRYFLKIGPWLTDLWEEQKTNQMFCQSFGRVLTLLTSSKSASQLKMVRRECQLNCLWQVTTNVVRDVNSCMDHNLANLCWSLSMKYVNLEPGKS